VHTVGGVIQAGEVVMLVVPTATPMIIEAKVQPSDVDQIHLGQSAVVRFSAFNRRTTPELNGEVIEIGADVTQDDKRNESYYSVRIRIPDSELSRIGRIASGGRHAGRGLYRDVAANRDVVSREADARAGRPDISRALARARLGNPPCPAALVKASCTIMSL